MECPSCGRDTPAGNYCRHCGHELPETTAGAEAQGEPGRPSGEAGESDGDSGVSIAIIILVAVIMIPVLLAFTVILAAVVGTFVLGLGTSVQENVQAGVNVNFDSTRGQVDVTFVSNQNAEYVDVRFTLDGDRAAGRLLDTGDRLRVEHAGAGYRGSASGGARWFDDGIGRAGAGWGPSGTYTRGEVGVVARGVSGNRSTVLLSESGEI